jgi:hypothetical protein
VSASPFLPSAALRRLTRNSPLLATSAACRAGGNPLGFRTRSLEVPEIRMLEHQGCSAEDWMRVQVQDGFDPATVRDAEFRGDVFLSRFHGTILLPGRVSLPTGIRRATIQDCAVGNACIRDVNLMSRQVIHDAAALVGVGAVVATGRCMYGAGQKLSVGLETGGREIVLFPELDLELATWLALHPGASPERTAYDEVLQGHLDKMLAAVGIVGTGAVVYNTAQVRNAWIGPCARIDGAQMLKDVSILSSMEEPVMVRDGAIVEHSILAAGSWVRSHAVVRKALLCPYAGAAKHAKVTESVLGPNTEVNEGEVSHSLLGPLVGFHHQSMLIAALWPEGRGNVSHGAAIGSNHTGRTADQELRLSEGMFLGLCTQMKYPADFSRAQHTILAMGTVTAPMRFSLPFSLLLPGAVPGAPNPCLPAWVLSQNAWALERAETKWHDRDRTSDKSCRKPLFGLDVLEAMRSARSALAAVSGQELWTGKEIPALGHCLLKEKDRKLAVTTYGEMLQLASLRALLEGTSHPLHTWARQFLSEEFPSAPLPQLLARLPVLERLWAGRVLRSREKDDERGQAVFEDYRAVHAAPKDDSVVKQASQRARETAKKVREALAGA